MFDSFYIYRKPDELTFHSGIGKMVHGLIPNGFFISSFFNTEEDMITILPERELAHSALDQMIENLDYDCCTYAFPPKSTTEEEHRSEVEQIVNSITEKEKTIACRAICNEGKINFSETLKALAEKFPSAFIFCFHTPATGTWIGATPEILLSSAENLLHTIALAGTRASSPLTNWDLKNIEEQNLVSEYIENIFRNNNMKIESKEGPKTYHLGKIEHLRTDFFINPEIQFSETKLVSLLKELSPTPALCGNPRSKSLELIAQNERFSRGYYGGYCGPIKDAGNFDFFVILRAIRAQENRWCMFAGGGITHCSIPEEEWLETERKAQSIIESLKFDK